MELIYLIEIFEDNYNIIRDCFNTDLVNMMKNQGRRHRGPCPPLFCIAKRKKGDKGKKERVSKQKLSKGCHQGQNIIVLAILESLEFENFSWWPRILFSVPCHPSPPPPACPPTLKSISPTLKIGCLLRRNKGNFNIYSLGSVYQKIIKIVSRNGNTQNVRKPYWFVTNS